MLTSRSQLKRQSSTPHNKCRQFAPAGPDTQPSAALQVGRRCRKRYRRWPFASEIGVVKRSMCFPTSTASTSKQLSYSSTFFPGGSYNRHAFHMKRHSASGCATFSFMGIIEKEVVAPGATSWPWLPHSLQHSASKPSTSRRPYNKSQQSLRWDVSTAAARRYCRPCAKRYVSFWNLR
jgi:hypothetical protein